MPNHYTLDDLKNDLDKKYAPLVIDIGDETITLVNVMRLSTSQRKRVLDAWKALAANDEETSPEDYERLVAEVFKLVVADGRGDLLVSQLEGDLALSMRLFEMWSEVTQPGEADSSPS